MEYKLPLFKTAKIDTTRFMRIETFEADMGEKTITITTTDNYHAWMSEVKNNRFTFITFTKIDDEDDIWNINYHSLQSNKFYIHVHPSECESALEALS